MAKWFFEPGHTAAEFCARHMMVSCVRGHFKNVHGTLEFDPENPQATSVDVTIDAAGLWSGEPDRDAHLKSADFLDVANHPTIRFGGSKVELVGADEARLSGELTIRGVTRPITLDVRYLGSWETPWWENGVDKGPRTRAGFLATARINRKDFGVNWHGVLDRGGLVVSDEVAITIEVEAIRED
jgi:polyisoprenoid-binding protein YceI